MELIIEQAYRQLERRVETCKRAAIKNIKDQDTMEYWISQAKTAINRKNRLTVWANKRGASK